VPRKNIVVWPASRELRIRIGGQTTITTEESPRKETIEEGTPVSKKSKQGKTTTSVNCQPPFHRGVELREEKKATKDSLRDTQRGEAESLNTPRRKHHHSTSKREKLETEEEGTKKRKTCPWGLYCTKKNLTRQGKVELKADETRRGESPILTGTKKKQHGKNFPRGEKNNRGQDRTAWCYFPNPPMGRRRQEELKTEKEEKETQGHFKP